VGITTALLVLERLLLVISERALLRPVLVRSPALLLTSYSNQACSHASTSVKTCTGPTSLRRWHCWPAAVRM
jgi:hypothetical protein